MVKRIFLIFLMLVTIPSLCLAEYRVFLLKIMKTSADPQVAQDFRLVESTLDHIQYRYYHPVAADENVTYIDTWRCYGRTGDFQPLCPNPKGQIPVSEPTTP